ncbi:hypothetical protein [Pseudomonas sp. Ant30-3]|uniref:hypothetical protein n=1 Tax=Pseudomonas sp. Ant30-3 TaxID=1488328 RepID=UPI000B2CF187|nr:hypothetical protein [Pseudomonas sp. Ant30-3]
MHHIHLASTRSIQLRWAKIDRQYYRTAARGDAANDFWLIYAYDTFRDEYLLLTVTGPDALTEENGVHFFERYSAKLSNHWIVGKLHFPDLNDF